MIPLADGEVHLWLASYEDASGANLHATYRQVLANDERAQEKRFYFERDRRRYLLTRALVRTTLSRYLALLPVHWKFSSNSYGRPEIVNAEAREAGLSFNVSHTHSLIVLGVAKGCALGVDVENILAQEASIELAEHYFAPREAAALKEAAEHQQQFRFFEYWTFKESYIKARGMGLSLPLDKFGFRYPSDRAVEIAIDPELADDATRWQFWQLRPSKEYLVAICAERTGAQPPRLVIRRTIPLVSEEMFSVNCVRASS